MFIHNDWTDACSFMIMIYKDTRKCVKRNKNEMKCCKTRLNNSEYISLLFKFSIGKKDRSSNNLIADLSIRPAENLNNEKES